MCGRIAPARITQSEPSLVHDEGCVRDYCQGVGHHAIDGRSVLGTGKALRVASTAHPARPSALTVPARSSRIGNCVMAGNLRPLK
jgi:hypothetical protein